MDNKKTKDSGIAWIGKIPEDWKEIRLKELFNKKQGGAWGEEAKEDENDRVCIRVADFDFERQTIKEGLKTVRNYSKDNICKLQMQGNELLIEKSGGGEKTPVGRSILSNGLEGYLYANFIDKLPIKSTNHPKYIAYYMKTLYQNNIVMPYIKQTTGIQNLDVETLLFEIISVPKYIIQHQITDYLDKKCSQIDELIANNQSQIDKLKEYKQSVITQAVTKGLDPDVETKDSGIDWIGQIPKNWSTNIGKRVLLLKKRFVREDDEVITCFRDGVVTLRKNRREEGFTFSEKEIGYQGIDVGDIVIHGMDGFAGAIGISDSKGKGSPVLSVCTPKLNMSSKYIVYYLRTLAINNVFIALSTGIRERSCDLRWSKIAILEFIIPEIKEQNEIVNYIDQKCSQIDSLIELKQQKIEKLQEYKKSLIYEYVTGKKEVG